MEKRFVFHICIAVVLSGGLGLTQPGLADSRWNIETVDATCDVGRTTSIALDTAGRAHISYWDYTKGDLKYAAYNGQSWDIRTVDSTGWSGYTVFTAIALDAAGRPHISYDSVGKAELKYAAFNGSRWGVEVVDSGQAMGSFTSLVLDAAGHPHISYADSINYDLMYATFDGSNWRIETVDSKGIAGWDTSIALDANSSRSFLINLVFSLSA